jgi:hypothetical protein
MSAESDFRALLAGNAPLVALVGTRIAQNAMKQGEPTPMVVFTATHQPEFGLNNSVHADRVTFDVQCWAATAIQADAVADAIVTCLAAVGVVATARATGFDAELGLDATVLTVEWWA